MSDLPALSVRQPWAWLIVTGTKDVENRSWRTNHRGRILIHAPIRIDQQTIDLWPWPAIERPTEFVTNAVLGSVEIIDCVERSSSPWFVGPWGFVLRNARMLREPRPSRGAQRLFYPEAKIGQTIRIVRTSRI